MAEANEIVLWLGIGVALGFLGGQFLAPLERAARIEARSKFAPVTKRKRRESLETD